MKKIKERKLVSVVAMARSTAWFMLWLLPLGGVSAQALLLYGGKDHNVFLGCLNCSDMDTGSVWNTMGDYGSPYSHLSIWNRYGDYGSRYSDYSPWNPYAAYPPVVVDASGGFYGYLTVNSTHPDRAEFDLALLLYRFYDLIRDDPAKWYDKIFEKTGGF